MKIPAAIASLTLLSSLCVAVCSAQGVQLTAGDVWIRDVTVISVERMTPLQHAHVVVRDGRILSVGTEAPRTGASAATVITGEGKYLTPGLIDGHVHLRSVPGITGEYEATHREVVAAYYRQLPRSYLYFGFTAVVDLNVLDPVTVNRIRSAELGPAVFDCGNALALANGYPMSNALPDTRFQLYPNFLFDDRQSGSIPARYKAADHSPEAAVKRVASGGGICVKAHYESGFGPDTGKLPVPTLEMMRGVREASRRYKLPLLLHANSLDAHRFAVESGADAVVHGLWNWSGASAGGELPATVRAVLDDERRAGVAYMPTLRVLYGIAGLYDPKFLDDPQLKAILPAELIAWYRTEEGQWFKRANAGGLSGERMHAIWTNAMPARQRATSYVAAQGGRVVFGSDTPSAPTFANPPGYNGYLELREMQAVGFTPRQILAAATLENARLFGFEKDYGTIESGKIASLLLLRANPLESTAAFDNIESVIVKGRVVRRESLRIEAK